jgi:DNA-binding protein HU-beta
LPAEFASRICKFAQKNLATQAECVVVRTDTPYGDVRNDPFQYEVDDNEVRGGLVPNKAQFVEMLSERFDGDKKRAAAALDAVIDTVYSAISKGERVALTGFGIFERRERAARMARNPATGAAVRVKKTAVPAFRAGAEFKAIASGARKLAKAPAQRAAEVAKTVAADVRKAAPGGRPAAKKAAKKAPVKKAAAKKAPAKKAAAKKAPAKKAAAKKAAKKAPAKKATR